MQFDKDRYRLIDRIVVQGTMDVFERFIANGLQDRSGQYEMALDIAEAIRDSHHVMIEAGVGIGKSLGYLIPSLFTTQCFRGPVVIATSSIVLSEQLMNDASQAKKLTGINVQTVLAKGQSNYICRKKIIEQEEILTNWKRNPHSVNGFDMNLTRVPQWIWKVSPKCKDRTELPELIEDRIWRYINADRCNSYKCTHKSECGFYLMRSSIGEFGDAKIIIANQDLLIINQINELRTGNSFINRNKRIIIIDEAHNLEDKTRSALTEKWSKNRILQVFSNLGRPLSRIYASEKHHKLIENSQILVDKMFDLIQKKMITTVEKDTEKREALRYKIPSFKNETLKKWAKSLESLITALTMSTNRYGTYQFSLSDEEAVDQLIRIQEFVSHLSEYFDGNSNYLFWAEGNYELLSSIELCFAPKDIDKELRKLLFNNSHVPVIMTSATLCQPNHDFSKAYRYMEKSTGFIGGQVYPPKPSPFPYDKNAMLYIANDIEDPSGDHDLYLLQITERIKDLAGITNGRTLVLFTSKEDLRTIESNLINLKLPWTILRQRDGGAQGNIRDEFTSSNGILLSTGFWEGFNVPGPDLSSVIITRLPFPVPDPVLEYKISKANDRLEVLVPEMLVKLRQGAGRLIRSDEDTGILSILDSRASSILDKPYRNSIIASLPIKRVTEDIEEIEKFVNLKIR